MKIEYLDLSHNNFGEESGKIKFVYKKVYVYKGLSKNVFLCFQMKGKILAPAIVENSSIKHLDLGWNNIRRKGAIAIAKAVAVIKITILLLVINPYNKLSKTSLNSFN